MSFFESDVVRAEMTEISELQEDVYRNVFKFSSMNTEAKQMKDKIIESATMMGLPQGTDMSAVFNNMSKMLQLMKKQIDNGEKDQ